MNIESLLVEATGVVIAAAIIIWRKGLSKTDKAIIFEELNNKVDKKEFYEFKSKILENYLSTQKYLEKIEEHIIMMDNSWRSELNKHFFDLKESLQTKTLT